MNKIIIEVIVHGISRLNVRRLAWMLAFVRLGGVKVYIKRKSWF